MKRPLLLLTVGVWACGSEDPQSPPGEVRAVLGAPTSASFALESEIALASPVLALGVSAESRPIFVNSDGVYEVEAGELIQHSYYRAEGDPLSLGAITAIAPRTAGGAFLGGEHGLFVLEDIFVTKSPLELEGAAVHAIEERSEGPLAGLWIATEQGLLLRTDARLVRLEFAGASGPVTSFGVEEAGNFALALVGGNLLLIEPDGAGGLTSDQPPLDTGAVHAIAAARGAVWAATEHGLFRYQPIESPAWQQIALADSMERAATVLNVAVDPVIGSAWALTGAALVEVDGDVARSYPLPAEAQGLALDTLGDVWVGGALELHRRGTGSNGSEEVSFAADLKPWITSHCSTCHRNQTQDFESYDVFKPLAELALARVRSGDMPRCQGGLRCSSEMRLSPNDYAILEQWLRLGSKE